MIRFLKIVGVALLIIMIIPLIAALFVKKEYQVEKSILVGQPRDTVFDYLVMLRHQDEFSVWGMMDPEMKKEFRGTDGTVGFVSAWESDDNHVGQGEQEITGIVPGERIDYELRFIKPFKSVSNAWMITGEADEGQTLVKWGFSGRMKYPMNAMLIFINMEKAIGKDYEQGLDNLKSILEKK